MIQKVSHSNTSTEAGPLVPEVLLPSSESRLPILTLETVTELAASGWSRVGLMTAFIDPQDRILLLRHHGRAKNEAGVFGPLGETSQHAGPDIEQPAETLYRGIIEELGIERPEQLSLKIRRAGGWVINAWPRGNKFPGEVSCAISFPVFMDKGTTELITSLPHGNEEIDGVTMMAPEDILAMEERCLRPGVKNWLAQLSTAGLLERPCPSEQVAIDFSPVFRAAMHDIDLQQ